MIPVVNRNVIAVNERFDPAERNPGMILEPSEDMLLSRRALVGKYSCSRACSTMGPSFGGHQHQVARVCLSRPP